MILPNIIELYKIINLVPLLDMYAFSSYGWNDAVDILAWIL